jgi:putative GTP pyrophosphokinase
VGVRKDFDGEYEQITKLLPAFGAALERLVEHLLQADKIRFHGVNCRVKSKDSAGRKVARKVAAEGAPRSLATVTDLLGLRVVTYFRDEVDAAAKVIEREFVIDEENSVDKRSVLDPDRFGYLSLHYVAQLNDSRIALPEYHPYGGIKFEIQIRSILQHAWAEIEHDLGYKSEAAVPRAIRRRFSRLAGVLELADDEFVGLRQEVDAHQVTASETIGQGTLGIEIDQDSLSAFVISSKQVRQFDRFVTTSLNGILSQRLDNEFIGRQAVALVNRGFHSVEDLSNYLDGQRDLLENFFNQWLSLMDTPRSGRTPVPLGVTLYYLEMLKYAQDLLAGNEEGAPHSGIGSDLLMQSLRAAMGDADPPS